MLWGRIASLVKSASSASQSPVDMGMCVSRSECPCESRRNSSSVEARRNSSSVAPAAEISPPGVHAATFHFVRLSGLAISPFTSGVRIALQFKGIQPDLVETAQSDRDAWLELGRSLRLEHGSDVVCGSADVIIDYIEKKFKKPSLIPSWKLKKKTRQWVAFVRDEFTPLVIAAWKNKDLRMDAEFFKNLSAAFGKLNAGIVKNATNRGNSKFFMGAAMTMVDVYLVPMLELVDQLKFLSGIEVGKGNTKLAEYMREMENFPSYVPVVADRAALRGLAGKELDDRSQEAPAVACTVIQHMGIVRHLDMLVEAVDELGAFYRDQAKCRPIKKKPSSKLQQRSPTMVQVGVATKLKNAARSYDRLLLLMQEHAQMEEKVIFPALENAERGVTRFATEDHARHFPIMNGAREDFKTVTVLEQGSCAHTEALSALATKLRALKDSTARHFLDEEKELLPSLEVAGLGARKQELLMAEGLSLMAASHSHLLPFFLSALQPHEIHHYMILLHRSLTQQQQQAKIEMFVSILRDTDEFHGVWEIVQERVPFLVATFNF